jgi:hypothetical protein
VLEQPCSTGGQTGTVQPKHLLAGRTGLSDQFLGPVGQDQPGPVGQICLTSWLLLRSDSARPTTSRTRLFEHRSNCRVRPVNAGSVQVSLLTSLFGILWTVCSAKSCQWSICRNLNPPRSRICRPAGWHLPATASVTRRMRSLACQQPIVSGLHHQQQLFDWEIVDLMDYHEDFVGSSANTLSDRMGDLTITLQQLLTSKGPHHSGATDGRCEAGDPGSRPPRRFASLGAPSGNQCEQGPQGLAREGLP